MSPGFRPLGLGLVTENKPHGEWFASIFLFEQAQLAGVDINSKEKQNVSIELANGGKKKITIKEDFKVKAKWLRVGDTNRITPPDLYINQTVLVYQKEGYDDYLWVPVFLQNEITVTESATYAWMARHKDDSAEKDPSYYEKMYRLNMSPKDGQVSFHTTDANDEKSTYSWTMDTKEGILEITDKQGNFSTLKSVDGVRTSFLVKDRYSKTGGSSNLWTVKDHVTKVDGSDFTIVKGSTLSKVDGAQGLQTKENIDFHTNGEVNLKSVKDTQAKTMGNIILNSNKDFHVLCNAGKATIIAPQGVSIMAPTINLVGAVQCGTLSCLALNIGGAAPQPPELKQPVMKALEFDKMDEAMKLIEEAYKEEEEDKEGGGSSASGKTRGGGSSGGSEEEKDPWADEAKPEEPQPLEEPQQAKSTMEKEAVMEANQGFTLNSQAKLELNGVQTKLSGTGGMAIEGVTGDITQLLIDIVTELATAIDTPSTVTGTCSTGPIAGTTVPPALGSKALATLQAKIQAWKGGG